MGDGLTKAQRVDKLLEYLVRDKDPWLELWEIVTQNVLPIREDLRNSYQPGFKLAREIYDGSPAGSLQLFAAGLHGYKISQQSPWFELRLPRFGLDDVPEVRLFLQEVSEQLYFALARSNFYSNMWRYFEDGGALGTATHYIEENPANGAVVFHDVHPGEVYISENDTEEIDTVFRVMSIEVRKLVDRFGLDVLPARERQIANTNPYERVDVVHAVFPRDEYDTTKLDGKNKRFASIWKMKNSTEGPDASILGESGYDQLPYNVWRYKKNSGEAYGRSPVMEVLPDIVGLQRMAKTILGAAELAVSPAMNVPAKLKQGGINLKPNGLNYFDNPKELITPIYQSANVPVGLDQQERKQKLIDRALMVDFFLMLASSEREMTATEVVEKAGEKAAVLGAPLGRLDSDALNTVIDRVFEIEFKAGRMPDPPAILEEFIGESINIEYIGPLALAQRRLFRSQGILRGMEALAPLVERDPRVLDNIDTDVATKELLESFGFPQKALRDRQTVQQIREQRAQAEQLAQMQESGMMASEAARNLAQADNQTGGKLSVGVEQMLEES